MTEPRDDYDDWRMPTHPPSDPGWAVEPSDYDDWRMLVAWASIAAVAIVTMLAAWL